MSQTLVHVKSDSDLSRECVTEFASERRGTKMNSAFWHDNAKVVVKVMPFYHHAPIRSFA